jgi:UDPglucose--hexose-1-phosphate uridylyltransferase
MWPRRPSMRRADGRGRRGAPRVDLALDPHRRHNPLLDEWVLVAASRTKRPWLGATEAESSAERPAFDPGCYLCPGNTRANGDVNPDYDATFVFTNDFSALRPDTGVGEFAEGLIRAEGEHGECRVVCFTPRHDLTLAAMAVGDVRRVVDLWADQTEELGRRYRWVQVFENRGAAMGASNPHPHGQIWAGTALPTIATREAATQAHHLSLTGRRMLLDYVGQEAGGPRIVAETDEWLAVVPFWAAWPFELLLVARRPAARLVELDAAARDDLAITLHRVMAGYDGLFRRPFPYSFGWHQAPFDGAGEGARDGSDGAWQLHAHVFPPLLRASVRKFMVGYELLAETQRDITAEDAAGRLRAAVGEAREAPTAPAHG